MEKWWWCICPPWIARYGTGNGRSQEPLGSALLFRPPQYRSRCNSETCSVPTSQWAVWCGTIITARSEMRKVLFLALSVCFFVCVWNISGTAERICAKFTRKTCLVPRSDELEGQGQRSKVKVTRDRNGIFRHFRRPACGLCLFWLLASLLRWKGTRS